MANFLRVSYNVRIYFSSNIEYDCCVFDLIPANIAVNSNNMHLHVMLLNEFQVAVLAAVRPWSVVYSRMQVFLVSPFGKVGSKSFATYITPK